MPATTDRGEIIHLAGFLRLSPALRAGEPALVPPGEGLGERCGWAAFFDALERRGLAVGWEAEQPASVRLLAAASARGAPAHPTRGALAEARRFLRAWRGDPG